ncbi:hypothetical protein [Actinomadura formosensis]|uniref:hypothetical protein n=1 Tax=Actinomadura formosensis TaxID=60706 RepID=UPI000830EF84|nr:hypothetical protein [Actinomadura formosensis]
METPRPSPAEELHAKHGHAWEIWREVLPGGRHGDWVAHTLPGAPSYRRLRARTVEELDALLSEAEA